MTGAEGSRTLRRTRCNRMPTSDRLREGAIVRGAMRPKRTTSSGCILIRKPAKNKQSIVRQRSPQTLVMSSIFLTGTSARTSVSVTTFMQFYMPVIMLPWRNDRASSSLYHLVIHLFSWSAYSERGHSYAGKKGRSVRQGASRGCFGDGGGLVDADLGGSLFKKRIPVPGRGKRGSARVIVATKRTDRWFFLYGFERRNSPTSAPRNGSSFRRSHRIC